MSRNSVFGMFGIVQVKNIWEISYDSTGVLHVRLLIYKYTSIYIYIYIYIYFIKQRVKARAIPSPHQLPSKGDNTVSVAQGGTATPGATKQLLPPDRVLREIYIYIYIIYISSFLVCIWWFKKNAFSFGCWCYYAFAVTVSYVITREW